MSNAAGKGADDTTAPALLGGAGQRLAGIYAQALLDAATRTGDLDDSLEQLRELAGQIGKTGNPFASLIDNPLATRDAIKGIIDRTFGGKSPESVLHFIHVLNDHGRLALLIPVIRTFERLVDQRKGRVAVQVRTATELDHGARASLEGTLRKTLGKEPVLGCTVDPELLGGMIVRVGDRVWDGSLSWQIRRLQDQLMERGNHAIQSGRDRFRTDR